MNKNNAMLDGALTSVFVMVMLQAFSGGTVEVPVPNEATRVAAAAQPDDRSVDDITAAFQALL